MRNEYIWILGGGILQLPMVHEAHRRGYKVLLSDRNKNCHCAGIVDLFLPIDIFDVEAHVTQAKSMSLKPKAVVVDAVDCGVTGAILAEHYGLPTCGYVGAINAHDKAKMRETLDVDHPVYLVIPKDSTPIDACNWWMMTASDAGISPYPCVVKSADNCASRGISIVKDAWDWQGAVSYARLHNRHSRYILIEEHLSGEEVSSDWFIDGSKAVYTNAAKRVFGDFGIEMGHTNPFIPTDAMTQQVNEAARKLGVNYGPFKCDFMYDTRYGWVILETAVRLSGGFDHTHTCPMATGKDVVNAVLDVALGLPLDINKLTPRWHKYAAAYAPPFKAGVVKYWQGIGKAHMSYGVEHVILRETHEIAPLSNCANRPVFVIARGDTEAEAWRNAVTASEHIVPVYMEE